MAGRESLKRPCTFPITPVRELILETDTPRNSQIPVIGCAHARVRSPRSHAHVRALTAARAAPARMCARPGTTWHRRWTTTRSPLTACSARMRTRRPSTWTPCSRRCGISSARMARPPPSTRRYPFVWRKGVLNGYSSARVSLWDSLMFGRLAMGFANVRAGTRETVGSPLYQ